MTDFIGTLKEELEKRHQSQTNINTDVHELIRYVCDYRSKCIQCDFWSRLICKCVSHASFIVTLSCANTNTRVEVNVVVLEDQFTNPCPWTSSPCPWTTNSLKIFSDFAFCKLSVMYDHVTSINTISATEHDDTVKNVLLMSNITYCFISASKPFFTVIQCCCPQVEDNNTGLL